MQIKDWMNRLLIVIVLTIWLSSNVTSSVIEVAEHTTAGKTNERIKLTGVRAEAYLGKSVSAGDVNGDGLSDVMIEACATGDPNYNNCTGMVYVLFGSRNNLFEVDLNKLTPSQGFTILGASSNELSVSRAGDINADGVDDIAVGDSGYSSMGRYESGAAYVIFGSKNGLPNVHLNDSLSSAQGFQIMGAKSSDALGNAVGAAGDINGDGVDDIIIGAIGAFNANGGAYVVYGSSKGCPNIDLGKLTSDQGFKMVGGYVYDYLGSSVSGAGDVNGDGIDDIIVGAFSASPLMRIKAGSAYVIFGNKGGLPDIGDINNLSPTQGFRILGEGTANYFGLSVSGAGDVNGDGIDDVIIGAYFASPLDKGFAGTAYVIYGSSESHSVIDTQKLSIKQGFKILGPVERAHLGHSVSNIGDINGDGLDDVIVSASTVKRGTGNTYIIFGSTTEVSQIDTSQLSSTQGIVFMGELETDNFGCSIANAGDVNGDGTNDLIVGACSAAREDMSEVGVVYIILSPFNGVSVDIM